MAEVEGVGELATGAALARAIEPRAGEVDGHTNEANCLNCGEPLAGAYCYRCGQRGHVHRTIGALWHDFLHSVLHVDGKFWATIRLLAWRPGDLTSRYIHGERAKFASPMALFLFSVFLMFAVTNAIGSPDFSGRQQVSAADRADLDRQLAELERERAEASAAGESAVVQDVGIAAVRGELARETAGPPPVEERPVVDLSESLPGWLAKAIGKARENPELLLYKIQSNAYKFSWLLIPISVPLVRLLFLHRRRYRQFRAYDHMVFVTYSLSFMTLLFVAATLVGELVRSNDLAVLALTIVPPVHIYRQIKGAYGLSTASALWRAALISLFALLCLSLFLVALVGVGLM